MQEFKIVLKVIMPIQCSYLLKIETIVLLGTPITLYVHSKCVLLLASYMFVLALVVESDHKEHFEESY